MRVRDGEVANAMRAFELGDYTSAYFSSDDAASKGCALVMLGAFDRGLEMIGSDRSPQSLFCGALAIWHCGDTREALQRLAEIPASSRLGEAARRLAKLIGVARIRVLLQARDDPKLPAADAVGAMKALPFLDVISIGTAQSSDLCIDMDSTLEDVLRRLPAGWVPDFYLCDMIEDHPPPIGIERAEFLTFFSTQDFDRHFHHCRHLLPLFDVAIAFGRAFHDELRNLACGQAFVCPLLMGVEPFAPSKDDLPKDIDIFVSGNLFNHSQGKTERLWTLSQLPDDFTIQLQDSHLSRAQYLTKLRRAKLTITYVQNWGITNSRAFEALGQKCGALYQDGSELGILLGERSGLVAYGPHNFAETLDAAVRTWDAKLSPCLKTAPEAVSQMYDFVSTRKRYAILLAAHASIYRKTVKKPHSFFSRIRYINRSPIRVFYNYNGRIERYQELQATFRRALETSRSYMARDAVGESFLYSHLLSRTAVQLALNEQLNIARNAGPLARRQVDFLETYDVHHKSSELRQAYETYRSLAEDFPDRIAAWFNRARLALEFGLTSDAEYAFNRIVSDAALRYLPDDLLFWREFQDSSYDYERMMFALRRFENSKDDAALREVEVGIREAAASSLVQLLEASDNDEKAGEVLSGIRIDSRSLPALWAASFRNALKRGDRRQAERIGNDILAQLPWILAVFGQELVENADRYGIDVPEIRQRFMRFRRRINQPAATTVRR